MSDVNPEKMEIVPSSVFVPAEMPNQASKELEMLGLSPEFPALLQGLNASLAESMGNSTRNFAGYKFILSPDANRPVVEAQQKYNFPFSIELDVSPLGRASLAIKPKFQDATLTSVRVDQLQSILGEANGDFAVTLFKPFSDEQIFSKPLQEMTEADITNASPSSKLLIAAHNEPVNDYPTNCTINAAKRTERSSANESIPAILIQGIEVDGPSRIVEASLGTIALLAKTWHARP